MRSSERVAAHLLALALPLALTIACQGETTTPTGVTAIPAAAAVVADKVVFRVVVIPDSQMVFVGDEFRVLAQPKNRAGQVLDRALSWKVVNTKIATAAGAPLPAMTFRAIKVGATAVKATADGKSGASRVVVRTVASAKVVVTPSVAAVAAGATVQFIATGLTKTGETAAVNVTWTATGGAISEGGVLAAGNAPGTYRVIATSRFGAADTSVVTIGAAPAPVAEVILVPGMASIAAGETVQFAVYGRTAEGDSVGVAVTYSATGGTVAGNGLYTAGELAGTYQVVAASAGVADTAEVVVSTAPVVRVVLLPDIAASRPGATTRFTASAWNAFGAGGPAPVTYETTCGTVTAAGAFTAPQDGSGSCAVTATVDGVADTTEVVLLPDTPGQGVPFGVNDLWDSPTSLKAAGSAPFTGSRENIAAADMVRHIQAARARGVRLVLVMTGGAHDRYKSNGVFDQAKWEAAMNAFDTPAIRDAVAEGVTDGTIIGNSVMDEPQQSGTTTKDWGPPGTMTKARVDQLCAYVKGIFPTLPVGVGHDHSAFEPGNSYQVCDFFASQYAARKGNLTAWRDAALALAARDGMAIIFSLNLLDGGPQDRSGALDCPGVGVGTHSRNCRMSPAEVREWGTLLGPVGCALMSWRYDAAFMAKPENQAAISDVAITLAGLPRRPCSAS